MTFTAWTLTTLVVLLIIATVTDVRRQMVYNWNTYPGIVLGFVLRWMDGGQPALEDSVKGFVTCGGLMLVCFVLFGLGGGDLKLIAMIGAFLGFERGVEALLWTLVLGGVLGAVVIVWQNGFVNILVSVWRQIRRMVQSRGWVPVAPAGRQQLQQPLFLAPAGLLAVLIVTADLWWGF